MAVEIFDVFLPLILQSVVLLWWDSDKAAAGINYSWEALGLLRVEEGAAIIEQVHRVESPGANLGLTGSWVVLESLNTTFSHHDLG